MIKKKGPEAEKKEAKKKKVLAENHEKDQRTEAEILADIQEAMAKTPVKDFILQFLMTLSSLAYQRLGIYQEPDKVTIDLDQAKMAIDCFSAILEIVKTDISSDENQALNAVLASLRMAYVEKSK